MTPLDLPDEPRWVEAHGIAAHPTSWRRALEHGGVIGHARAKLAVIHGAPPPATIDALARELADHTLLVASEPLRAALDASGRRPLRAILHTLADPAALPELDGATLLGPDVSLAHVPADLADELAVARTLGPIWTVFVDGEPVSFAYAPWRSARWFDVSVDTLPAARQLGLGAIVASTMIHAERAAGREPVWGADEHNLASLRLADRLGFVPIDELWVAPPTRGDALH
ncbi:MAG: GNAT family N-acetyltransferase [Myxococcota bacterium]|nr:GNAT family N-acetyltransferase [Myxococcota bacterium]